MSDLEIRSVYPAESLEIRQDGRTITGSFKYGALAVIADRGTVRKERFQPGAFSYALRDEKREINLLSGHEFSKPLASRLAGSLVFTDSAQSLDFRATLPPENEQPSWMRDTVMGIRAGLIRGISPGFKVPPKSAVPDGEELVPEPGSTEGVMIRQINQAVLYEFSTLSRAAYPTATLDIRQGIVTPDGRIRRAAYRWL